MSNVWQVAAGDAQHCYGDLFLKHDVIFTGPGRFGPYSEQAYRPHVGLGHLTGNALGQIRSLATKMNQGDVVLLRVGYGIEAIGLVADEEYDWKGTFDDVFGWDLQHTRRVIWQDQLQGGLAAAQRKGGLFSGRKQIPTLTKVSDKKVLDPIGPLLTECEPRALRPLPEPPPAQLEPDELGQELFSKGLANEAVDKVLLAIQRQRRMIRWYETHGTASLRPTEHEVVAHMLLPLMLALGWSEQLIAIEWHKIDLACFWGTPTTNANCVLVCEAKHLGHGLGNVFDQAVKYVEDYKLSGARRVLLTDGKRLYLHDRQQDGTWGGRPVGYLNVDLIRTRYIAPPNANAVDTIMGLTPVGVERRLGQTQ